MLVGFSESILVVSWLLFLAMGCLHRQMPYCSLLNGLLESWDRGEQTTLG